MRKYVFILTYIMLALTAAAQKLTVNAPAKVQNGETFRLEYSINTTDVGGQLHIGSLPDALEVVYGPSVSQQESYSMVNGHVSSSASITYTYMVQANKNGTFTMQ